MEIISDDFLKGYHSSEIPLLFLYISLFYLK